MAIAATEETSPEAIKQTIEAMPLDEFDDLLKTVVHTKGHEGRPQHGELISQLKHHVKVQPDEPIQTKPSDKECKTILKSLAEKEKNHRPSSNTSSFSGGSKGPNLNSNGNILAPGLHLPHYVHQKHSLSGPTSLSSSVRAYNTTTTSGDQNANPIASSSNCNDKTPSIYTPHLPSLPNSTPGKYQNLNNHHHHANSNSSTLYNNSLDGDPGPGGYHNYTRRNHERDASSRNSANPLSGPLLPLHKLPLNDHIKSKEKDDDDDDTQETYLDPGQFTDGLPPQYIHPAVTKFNATSKDIPLQLFPKSNPLSLTALDGASGSQPSSSSSSSLIGGTTLSSSASGSDETDDQPGTSKAPYSSYRRTESLQLKDAYKSVASVTSGSGTSAVPTCSGRATYSANEETFGTVRAVSPNPSSAVMSKSPSIDGSGSQDNKPTGRRIPRKKPSKNGVRESVVKADEIPGYKGNEDLDKLLAFVEGGELGKDSKSKKPPKDPKDKKKDGKPNKGNEKQLLSKAASLDENSLGYGSKKSNEENAAAPGSKSRNSKDVERKNSTNVTKSTSAICGDYSSIMKAAESETIKSPSTPLKQQQSDNKSSSSSSSSNSPGSCLSSPMVNGGIPLPASKTPKAASSSSASKTGPTSASSKSQAVVPGADTKQSQTGSSAVAVAVPLKSETSAVVSSTSKLTTPLEPKQVKSLSSEKNKSEEDRLARPDESDGPYVLVQSKKKRDRKKQSPLVGENSSRSHLEPNRREGGRPRRTNTERRKSVGSVPGSENSECSDDDDSVRSLPAGECTPRERIRKPCSSSGGTPQTSYADIARMSKDETGKSASAATAPTVTSPAAATITAPPPAVTSVPPGPKTPSPAAKITPPPATVATPVVTSTDDMFPALSPPTSSEKTAITPVSSVVWQCRPRIAEMDTANISKDKSVAVVNISSTTTTTTATNKQEDACTLTTNMSKDAFPPMAPAAPVSLNSTHPLKCSTNNKESSQKSADSILNNNNNINKDLTVGPVKSTMDTSATMKQETVVQNGLPKAKIVAEIIAPKATGLTKNRVEEKKLKDKPVKQVQEDYQSKVQTSSKPASENGDFHSAEPVVFCGGKFESTQLPVGQKIGFEFGFGVIEALNDNNVPMAPIENGLKGVEFASVVNNNVNATTAVTSILTNDVNAASHGKNTSLNHVDSNPPKEKSAYREVTVNKPQEKPVNTPHPTKPSGKNRGQNNHVPVEPTPSPSVVSTTQAAAVQPQPSPLVNKKSSRPGTDSTAITVISIPQANASVVQSMAARISSDNLKPSTANKISESSSKSPVDKSLKEYPSKINIAQLYKPPTLVKVPDSVHAAPEWHEKYIQKLCIAVKEGKRRMHVVA